MVLALLRAPYVTLPVLKELWWSQPGSICVFDSDSELPGGVEPYVLNLRKALEKQPPAQVIQLREECLRGVDETLEELRKNKDKE